MKHERMPQNFSAPAPLEFVAIDTSVAFPEKALGKQYGALSTDCYSNALTPLTREYDIHTSHNCFTRQLDTAVWHLKLRIDQ